MTDAKLDEIQAEFEKEFPSAITNRRVWGRYTGEWSDCFNGFVLARNLRAILCEYEFKAVGNAVGAMHGVCRKCGEKPTLFSIPPAAPAAPEVSPVHMVMDVACSHGFVAGPAISPVVVAWQVGSYLTSSKDYAEAADGIMGGGYSKPLGVITATVQSDDPRISHGAALLMIANLNREVADLNDRVASITAQKRQRGCT